MPSNKGEMKMGTIAKLKNPGGALVADEIGNHGTEQALRAAQYAYDMKLHDARTAFLALEKQLRKEFLETVAAIADE
jgi:hypothetical protein